MKSPPFRGTRREIGHGRSRRGCLKRLIATPLPPGIEITWLPSVVPAGPKKKETAVPERTTVGSPGFQSRASAESLSTTFETPSKVGPPAPRSPLLRAVRVHLRSQVRARIRRPRETIRVHPRPQLGLPDRRDDLLDRRSPELREPTPSVRGWPHPLLLCGSRWACCEDHEEDQGDVDQSSASHTHLQRKLPPLRPGMEGRGKSFLLRGCLKSG